MKKLVKKFVAYNKLYLRGKPTGQRYKAASGPDKELLRKRVQKDNKAWNKSEKKSGYSDKLVEIKRVGGKRKKGVKRRRQRRQYVPFAGPLNYF